MIEEIDRLPDWAYTEEELDNLAIELIEPSSKDGEKHVALYEMYKDGKSTGIVMLLATESISDGLHAINRIWGGLGLYAEIWEFNEKANKRACDKVEDLLNGLENIKYKPKKRLVGWNKMLQKREWLKELI